MLYKVVRDGLSDEMTFEQIAEMRAQARWGPRECYTGRWESKCKGPEAGECLAYSRIRKEPSVGESEM